MDIVIIGAGRVGLTLCERLAAEGHSIMVIESKAENITRLADNLDVMAIEGNGADYFIQTEAGVADSDLLICATESDSVNMLCCLTAKKLGARNTIARVRTMEYYRQMVFLKDELGISLAFNPEKLAADEISRILRFPLAENVNSFANGKAEIVEFVVSDNCSLCGVPLSKMNNTENSHVLICAVQREGNVFIPRGDYVIERGDKLHIIGAPDNVSAFFKSLGMHKRGARHIMLIGGSRIAGYLANQLSNVGMKVKIIEQNKERCLELAKELPKAEIICGDGSDPTVLHEEGIEDTDAFVSLSGSDHNNIMSALFASKSNVPKVIAKVNDEKLRKMIGTVGFGSCITPKFIAADFITQFARGMQNSLDSSGIEALHKIADSEAETIEFNIAATEKSIGVPLKDLKIRPDTILGAIIRGNKCIFPRGDDCVMAKDKVIAVSTHFGMQSFRDIFEDA